MDLHSHLVEAAGTLVDDTEAAVAVVAQRGWRAEKAVVIANSILKLVDLGDLGLQFPLEMLQLKLLGLKLLIPTYQLCL